MRFCVPDPGTRAFWQSKGFQQPLMSAPWKIHPGNQHDNGKQHFEDVSPIQTGWFYTVMLVFRRVRSLKLKWNLKTGGFGGNDPFLFGSNCLCSVVFWLVFREGTFKKRGWRTTKRKTTAQSCWVFFSSDFQGKKNCTLLRSWGGLETCFSNASVAWFRSPIGKFHGSPKQCGNTWGSYGSSKKPGWLDRGGGRVARGFHRYFRGFVLACSFRLCEFS